MLQHQWRDDGPSAPTTSTSWAEPTVGQRALSLATCPGVWAVVPAAAGHQRSGGGGGAQGALGRSGRVAKGEHFSLMC